MADGYLNFDTKVNTDGFEKGTKKVEDEYKRLKAEISKTSKELSQLKELQQQFDDSGVKKDSKAYQQLQDEIKKTENVLNGLKTDFSNAENLIGLQKEIDKTSATLDRLYERFDKYNALGKNPDSEAFKSLQYDIEQAENKLAELKAKAQEPVYVEFDTSRIDDITSRTESNRQAFESLQQSGTSAAERIKSAFSKAGDIFSSIGDKAKNLGATVVKSIAKKAGNGIKSFFQKFKGGDSTLDKTIKKLGSFRKMIERRLVMKAFNAVFKDMQENIDYLAKASPQFNKDFSSLKNGLSQVGASFITAFQPILEVAAPILERFLGLLAEVGNKLGEFFSALTGKKTTVKATKQQTDYAKSLDKTAKSADKASKALGAYDKLQVISSQNNSDSGSGGSNPYTTTTVSEDISSFADEIKKAWENADFSGIGAALQKKLVTELDSIDWGKITEKGKKLASSVATGINGFFSLNENGEATLGKSIGSFIANALSSATSIFDTFVWKIDTYAIARNITTALQTAFKDYNWFTFGHALSGILIKSTDFITGLVDGVNWEELPGEVWNAVKEAFLGFEFDSFFDSQENLIMSFHNAIDGLIDGIFSPVTDWLDREFKKIKEWWQGKDGKSGKKAEISKWFSSLPSAISSGIGNIWDKVKTKFEDFKKKVKIWWQGEDGKSGFKGYIKDKFKSLPSTISSGIGNIWDSVNKKFADFKKNALVWWQGEDGKGGFKKTLKDKFKIDFTVGKWSDLKEKLKGIINSIIDWANKNVVPKLQKLFQFTIPNNKAAKVLLPDDILGKSYNLITVPKIPKLATGMVVPANNGEFLSILGDNRKAPEVVSPVPTMQEAMREVLDERSSNERLVLQFDKRTFLDVLLDEVRKKNKQNGKYVLRV